MKQLRFITLAILSFTGHISAEPAAQVAWTPETIEFVKKGDAVNGKKLSQGCIGCHGKKGISPVPNFPSLAGQLANYIYKQLHDYHDGNRSDEIMSSIAAGLSQQDIADLAVWFSSLPPLEWHEKGEITQAAIDDMFSSAFL